MKLYCDQCTHCQESKRKALKYLRQGMRLLKDGEIYIVAQVASAKFALIGLGDGNRWTEGQFTLDGLLAVANKDKFTVVQD